MLLCCYPNSHLGWVWIAMKRKGLRFSCGSRALFIGSTSTDFNNFFFKIESSTIYTFKNYLTTIFLVFSNKWCLNRSLESLCINESRFFLGQQPSITDPMIGFKGFEKPISNTITAGPRFCIRKSHLKSTEPVWKSSEI